MESSLGQGIVRKLRASIGNIGEPRPRAVG